MHATLEQNQMHEYRIQQSDRTHIHKYGKIISFQDITDVITWIYYIEQHFIPEKKDDEKSEVVLPYTSILSFKTAYQSLNIKFSTSENL